MAARCSGVVEIEVERVAGPRARWSAKLEFGSESVLENDVSGDSSVKKIAGRFFFIKQPTGGGI